jgi:hypothetical protein
MTDFLKLEMPIKGKDNIAFENLKQTGCLRGSELFTIDIGHKPLKLAINATQTAFKIEGSFPYFWQGHNFSFPNSKIVESVDYISELICNDLFESEILQVEFGAVFQVNRHPGQILENHRNPVGFSFQHIGRKHYTGKQFSNQHRTIKFYDVVARLKQQRFTKSKLATIEGYTIGNHYMRFEQRINKPGAYLNKRNLSLKTYLADDIQQSLIDDLVLTYQQLPTEKVFQLMNNHFPTTTELALLELQKFTDPFLAMRERLNIEKANGKIDQITRKNRLRQLKAIERKFSVTEDSELNIKKNLIQSLLQD